MIETMDVYVVGMHYHFKDTAAIGQKSKTFDKSDAQLQKIYPDGKNVYAYYFGELPGEIHIDDSVENDYLRMPVVVLGHTVAYVYEDRQPAVRAVLPYCQAVRVKITGGPVKYVRPDDVTLYESDFTVRVYLDYDNATDPLGNIDKVINEHKAASAKPAPKPAPKPEKKKSSFIKLLFGK